MNTKLLRVGILVLSAAAFAGCEGAVDSTSGGTPVGPTQQALQTLHNHVRPVVSNGKALLAGHLPATQGLKVSLVLSGRNQAALTTFLEQVYDPASPNFHQFLSVDEFTNQFGPTADDYQAVVDFAKANGLTVTDKATNRAVVPLSGTVEQLEKALHVKMNLYQHPTENRTFFSPDREPSLDLKVAVNHISGLNNYSIPRPALALPSANQATPAVTGSGPGGTSYLASDMRAAYYTTTTGETGLTGSGQTVGLVQFDGYKISDVVLSSDGTVTSTANGTNFVLTYTPKTGGTAFSIPVNNVLLDGATGAACQLIPSACQDAEQSLDILQSIGMAPGLSQVRVYIGSSDVDILNAIATENLAKEVSISWLWSPDDPSTDDFIFQELAAQGQSVFVASGDDGAYNPSSEFTVGHFFPAEDPWVTSVGGTTLTTGGTAGGGPWSSETAWVDSGGGISLDGFLIPTYQAGLANTANGASTAVRNLPDVAGEADFDNYTCSLGACLATYGGTSFAAPRWAGFLALVNQQAVAAHRPTLGFVNPLVYAIGKGSSFGGDFHDITRGNNNNGGSASFNAVAGYDLVTGWGSPMGQSLINTLAPPASAGFQLSASPASETVNPSGTATTTVTVSDVGGFTGNVTLSVSGLPNGVTASFGTNPTAASSVLTLTASGSVTRGSYLLALTGVSGTLSGSTSLALEVNAPGFSISAEPRTVLFQGSSASNTIAVTNFAGFTGNVSLAVTSPLPAGVTSYWLTNPTTGISELTLTASDTAVISPQANEVTVTGVSGTLVETDTFDLIMDRPAFTLAMSPIPAADIVQGGSVSATLWVVPQGAFTEQVSLRDDTPPGQAAGLTATFATNPFTTSSVVTLSVSSTFPLGSFRIGLDGTDVCPSCTTTDQSGIGLNRTVTATPTPEFTLGLSPVAMTVTQGGSASTAVTVNKLNGFTGTVALALDGNFPLPNGVTGSLNASTGALTLTASSTADVGLTQLEIDGTSGSLSTIAQPYLTVNPAPLFTLSASSASVTVAAGSSVNDTITLTPQTGFTGNAMLTTAGQPNGVSAAFGTNPATASSVLTITAGTLAPAGNYQLIVAGTSGGKAVTIPITLTVTSPSDAGSISDAGMDATVDASDASSSDAAADASGTTGCASGSTLIAETGCASFPNFNTTSAVCVKVKVNTVNGWNASNVQGRTATVRGATTQGPIAPVNGSISNQPGLSAGADGFVYFNFTAGSVPYTSMSCW